MAEHEVVCAECGDRHRHLPEEEAVVAEVTSAEVEIARINAKRDIELARIAAGQYREEAVVEAVVETAHAEGVVDGLETILASQQPPAPEQPGLPDVDPIVIVNDNDNEPEIAEPPEHEHHEPPKRDSGLW